MAEEALKQLEEQLSYSICLHTYNDPKLPQCFHACLLSMMLVDRDQEVVLASLVPRVLIGGGGGGGG